MMQLMHPPHKFKSQPFKEKGLIYGIKSCHIEVHYNSITSIQSIIQIYQAIQKISIDSRALDVGLTIPPWKILLSRNLKKQQPDTLGGRRF
jgi:hypothetical protein